MCVCVSEIDKVEGDEGKKNGGARASSLANLIFLVVAR